MNNEIDSNGVNIQTNNQNNNAQTMQPNLNVAVNPQVQAPVAVPTAQVQNPQVQAPVSAPTAQVQNPQVQAPVSAPTAQVQNPQVQAPVSAPTAQVQNSQVQAPVAAPTAQMQNLQVQAPVSAPTISPQSVDPNQLIVNTKKEKHSSNVILFIIVGILIACIYFMDDILGYFTVKFTPTINTNIDENTTNNLYHGFIKIDQNDSFIKLQKIKFYNFKKIGNKTISLNYVSDKRYDTASDLKIYIELYDSNEELIYKELFNPKKTINSDVNQYNLNVENDIYIDASYTKIVNYTSKEENETFSVICEYTKDVNGSKLNYKNTYNFKNNEIISYSVNESIDSNNSNDELKKIINDDYEKINGYNINSNHTDYNLEYTIVYNNLPQGYNPLYSSSITKKRLLNKETLKKWNCK